MESDLRMNIARSSKENECDVKHDFLPQRTILVDFSRIKKKKRPIKNLQIYCSITYQAELTESQVLLTERKW